MRCHPTFWAALSAWKAGDWAWHTFIPPGGSLARSGAAQRYFAPSSRIFYATPVKSVRPWSISAGIYCSILEQIFPERVEHNSHWPSNRVIKRPLPSMEDGESVYNSQCIRLDEENAAGPQRQTPAREFFFAPGSRRSGLLREENRSPRTKGLRLAVCLSRAVFSSPGFRDVAVMWAEPCPAHGDGREYCLLEPGRHLFASTWRHRAFIPCSLTDAYQAHSP